jgi:hypothetical protein
MKIFQIRCRYSATATLSQVLAPICGDIIRMDDILWNFCWALEDVTRKPDAQKIYGQTAIPQGLYEMILTFSNRFRMILPELINVPGFTKIRIHGGNTDKDTDGCPLYGCERINDTKIYNHICVHILVKAMELRKLERHYIHIIDTSPFWFGNKI